MAFWDNLKNYINTGDTAAKIKDFQFTESPAYGKTNLVFDLLKGTLGAYSNYSKGGDAASQWTALLGTPLSNYGEKLDYRKKLNSF